MKLKIAALAAVSVAALVACGGGGDPLQVASTNATVAVAATAAAAVVNTDFAFPSGVAELGTTAATTVKFTSSSAAPAFSIASGGNTATGTTTFGSCIFVISASTFPAGSRLAQGNTVVVNPCNISVQTAGLQATGVSATRSAALALGSAVSAGTSITVLVNAGGQLIVNGANIGNVTLVPVTGA